MSETKSQTKSWIASSGTLPPIDDRQAKVGFEHWEERLARLGDPGLQGTAARLAESDPSRSLLGVVFSYSPFLSQALLRDIPFFVTLVERGPDSALEEMRETLDKTVENARQKAALMQALREARRRTALAVALADIAGAWPLERVTEALSDFADHAMEQALAWLLHEAAERDELALPDSARPTSGCGYVLLAMGKLGARELNYSSDIDLIALFDPERAPLTGKKDAQSLFVRITRDLARVLDERTADGYVFRTDFRLRPDPAATPLALSFLAAETYYESLGQNWERAAMIKVRPAAGDLELGRQFREVLRPFIWRRNLDFWAIQDVHSIKRQIHAHRGGAEIAVEGHNLKLGRGGIREIEFYVQTQQLIFGGREPELRCPRTLDALSALAQSGHIEGATAEELSACYRTLRRLEHRLQMIEDQQTHSLPSREEGLARFAAFAGEADTAAFRRQLLATLGCVEQHYAALFEEAPDLSGPGNLVFTGGEPDPDTIQTLETMGFADGVKVYNLVKGWHHGRYRALRAVRTRQILTELMPRLLQQLSATAQPDAALTHFDAFLRGLPAGMQLFSMIYANPVLLELLAEVMGSAPALAERLSQRPSLLDAVVAGDFFDAIPGREALRKELDDILSQARDYEDLLDLSRRWANDRKFQVGAHILRQADDVSTTGRALSNIAEIVVGALLPAVEQPLAEAHGRPPGEGLAVVALGKLGGREMTVTSDLDLLFIYDAPEGDAATQGPRPLATSQYFGRLAQRFISAMSALTAEGRLYEVDMRLRPSGNAGPIAVSLPGFERYQSEQAWTWEHMVLTRARVLAGGAAFGGRVQQTIHDLLCRPRDRDKLLHDVAAMRARIARQHKPESPWRVKHWRGGLVDLEFIAQYLQLRHAAEHPGLIEGNTEDAFSKLSSSGILEQKVADRLIAATHLLRQIQSVVRLCLARPFEEEAAPTGVKAILTRTVGAPDFETLRRQLLETTEQTYAEFQRLIEQPAGALGESEEA